MQELNIVETNEVSAGTGILLVLAGPLLGSVIGTIARPVDAGDKGNSAE